MRSLFILICMLPDRHFVLKKVKKKELSKLNRIILPENSRFDETFLLRARKKPGAVQAPSRKLSAQPGPVAKLLLANRAILLPPSLRRLRLFRAILLPLSDAMLGARGAFLCHSYSRRIDEERRMPRESKIDNPKSPKRILAGPLDILDAFRNTVGAGQVAQW